MRCIMRRCMYCVSQGDTLASVMEALVGDGNWLRLWAANGNEDGLNETVTIYHPVTWRGPVRSHNYRFWCHEIPASESFKPITVTIYTTR